MLINNVKLKTVLLVALSYVGVYQHYYSVDGKNPGEKSGDRIEISAKGGRLSAIYTGVEDFGEGGMGHYRSTIETIDVLPDGSIKFRMPPRDSYPELKDIGSGKEAARTNPDAVYTGKLVNNDLIFLCQAEDNQEWPQQDCLEKNMTFKRVKK